MLRNVDPYFFNDLSGQYSGSIFKSQTVQEDFLTLEDGNHKLSRNVGKYLPTYSA
jgi:hypothetical protein